MSDTTNDTFRIDRLTLKNFRCFEEKTIDFSPRFNVLIGGNAKGKTAVLDALAAGCGAVVSGLRGNFTAPKCFTEADVRVLTFPEGNVERQLPSDVTWAISLSTEEHHLSLTQGSSQGSFTAQSIQRPLAEIAARVAAGDAVQLPVAAYYPAERKGSHPLVEPGDLLEPGPRVDGYQSCMRATLDAGQFVVWFKTMELDSFQRGTTSPGLVGVREAVRSAVADCTDVRFLGARNEVVVTLRTGERLPFNVLSHGMRGMLAMVGDMAWRGFVLNPHLGADAARETPGVVLIDEIDLHLHPSWQRHVVDDLKRAFPKVQFIVTTHSPFIIQSLEPGELIKLDAEGPEAHVDPEDYVDRSIEEVAELVQDVDDAPMSLRRKRMYEVAEEYYCLLQQGKDASDEEKTRLKEELDRLEEPYSDNVAYRAFLRIERIAAGMGDGEQ
ncbi:MAG: AAA family ATPase [Armatimonadetes bacterium]|nr:AAA family ATPase [Armatimonadota bacterium]